MKQVYHSWSQRVFQLIGLILFLAGFFVFYTVGTELVPLFERYVQGSHDVFMTFSTLSAFCVGVPALLWSGVRFMQLRSFSHAWLYAIAFPFVAYLHGLFGPERLYEMDYLLTQGVVYFVFYFFIVGLVCFVYERWYKPLSHEKARHVRRELPRGTPVARRVFYFACFVTGLLVLHPQPIETTLTMLYSPLWHVLSALQ